MMDFEASFGAPAASASGITVKITRTEEQMSVLMQRFTAYIIEINDFGKVKEVGHRYSDFETLHRTLLTECVRLDIPPMPPKGADGTDTAVIAARKVELEKILRKLLESPEVLMEKGLHLWNFLELEKPSIVVGRFVAVPRARMNVLNTMAKLKDDQYKDDVYRLGHSTVTVLLVEGLRELRRGAGADSTHWASQQGGRTALCQLVAASLATSQEARERLLEADIVSTLLGIVQLEESALDEARLGLNVIVAKEGDRLSGIIAKFLLSGGLHQLVDLVQRQKCQEFVAKLLWLSWDAATRAAFARPGGAGLKVLQTLLRSSAPMCSLLGAVLLAGMVAGGDFDPEPAHRTEALRLVQNTLSHPEVASKDPAFAKVLTGAQAALGRLAAMLDDPDLAPLVLGLLCYAKPPAAKLSQISGNLAAMVGKGSSHSETVRAKAAELLLHIQSGSSGPSAVSNTGARASAALPNGEGASRASGTPAYNPSSSASRPSAAAIDDFLNRCEGIAAHEESIEAALRTQLEDGVAQGLRSLEERSAGVREASGLAQKRLQEMPVLDFQAFNALFTSYRNSREALSTDVRKCQTLHDTIERQLLDLRTARPSSVDPHLFKERLLMAERLYADVKSQREAFAAAEAESRERTSKADASSSRMRELGESLRKYDQELLELRSQRTDRESRASQLRSKANMPGLAEMKRQAQENIDNNLAEAKQLQTIGQRVQQGDPDFLREGESREQKIAELTAKLAELKRQHQVLLQKQKEWEIDPISLGDQASRLENEAAELDIRIGSLEDKQREAERARADISTEASRDAEDARLARDRRSSLSTALARVEQDAKSQIANLQPMIQEQHAGWQRLLDKQKRVDEDQYSLVTKLAETKRAAESEAMAREQVAGAVQELISSLLGFASFLESCSGEAPPVASPATSAFMPEPRVASAASLAATGSMSASSAVKNIFAETAEEEKDIFAEPPAAPALVKEALPVASMAEAPPAQAAMSAPATLNDDDFDAFLKEDLSVSFGTANGGSENLAPAPETAASPDEL